VDLIHAGTMTAEMVAHCWAVIARGASFLTAARPGGAGKSTVLANLLCLLPPREEIVTVTDPTVVDDRAPKCHLAHEIGRGHWYGYIWGRDVADFLALTQRGDRIASCIHADTLPELRDILLSPPLQVPAQHFNLVDLILFVHVKPGDQRRVVTLWESTGDGHRLAFEWDESTDQIVRTGPSALLSRLGADEEDFEAKLEAVRQIVEEGDGGFEIVREKVLEGRGR
jgi:hypothetical protein